MVAISLLNLWDIIPLQTHSNELGQRDNMIQTAVTHIIFMTQQQPFHL